MYDYSFLKFEEWSFGVNAGLSATFFYNFRLVDQSKEDYVLDPFYAEPFDLESDTRNEKPSFNAFLPI